eukprot:6169424-Pleurochrysis_carterae.AAC.1
MTLDTVRIRFGEDAVLRTARYRSHQRSGAPAGVVRAVCPFGSASGLLENVQPRARPVSPTLHPCLARYHSKASAVSLDPPVIEQAGDGPIALMLAPTRELALQ